MTVQLIDDGGGKSHLQWDSPSTNDDKLINLASDAAKNLHLKGQSDFVDEEGQPVDPDTLTLGQLAGIMSDYYLMTSLAEAENYYINRAQYDAKETAVEEVADRYS